MKRKIATGTDKDQMIADLRSRLDWFANEASPEEYNEAEVTAIKELLGVLCRETSGDKLEESLSGFWKTKEIRKKIRWEKFRLRSGQVSLADYQDNEEAGDVNMEADKEVGKETGTKKKTYRFFRRTGMYKGIVAAALVVALFLGGTAGAYAQKSGVFFWLRKDKDAVEMLVSPERMDDIGKGSMQYNTIDEVPEKYRGCIWVPDQVPQGIEFVCYEILQSGKWTRILSLYKNEEKDLKVEFVQRVFEYGTEYYLQRYDSYEYLYTKEYNSAVLDFHVKESDDEIEYAVCFLHNNVQHIVQGNLTLDEIEKLADEYCRDVVN